MQMTPLTKLFLIRHGEVEQRYQRVFGGRINMELSPNGLLQAEKTAAYLQPVQFDAIYVSPMKRALQTVAPLLAGRNREPVVVDAFREVDFGDWTGLSWDQVYEKFQLSAFDWLDLIEAAKLPNGETGAQFSGRIEPPLKRILKAHPGETIAIVCHGGVVRAMLGLLFDLPLPKTGTFEIDYASLTEVHIAPQKRVIDRLNFTPWRDLR